MEPRKDAQSRTAVHGGGATGILASLSSQRKQLPRTETCGVISSRQRSSAYGDWCREIM